MADIELVIKIPEHCLEELRHIELNESNEGIVFHAIRCIMQGTPLPKDNKCKWIHYDYRTVCPREHDIDNSYWRIPENRMEALRYCPYCGKEIEIEVDKGE